jgi:hypothetical protein
MKITSWNFKQPTKRPSQQWSDGRASLRFSTGRGKPGAMFTSCGPTIFLEIFGPSKWWLGDRTNYWAWGLPGLVNKHFATPIEIVDLAINSMLVIFHSSVTVYQRIPHDCCGGYLWAFGLPKMQTTRPYFLPYFLQFHSLPVLTRSNNVAGDANTIGVVFDWTNFGFPFWDEHTILPHIPCTLAHRICCFPFNRANKSNFFHLQSILFSHFQ